MVQCRLERLKQSQHPVKTITGRFLTHWLRHCRQNRCHHSQILSQVCYWYLENGIQMLSNTVFRAAPAKRHGASAGKTFVSPVVGFGRGATIAMVPCLRLMMLPTVLLCWAILCVVVAEREGNMGPTRNAAEDLAARGERQRNGAIWQVAPHARQACCTLCS